MAEHTLLRTPGVKHAAELFKEGSPRKILICCWQDGCVTSCIVESGEQQCCYTAEDGGKELYEAWQQHLTSPEVGYQVREVAVESAPEVVNRVNRAAPCPACGETERLKLLQRGVVV